MKRLIDANALKKEAWPERYTGEGIIYVEDVDKAPTVDAVEVVHNETIPLMNFRGLRRTKFGLEPYAIKRPPQSWCYVEDL